jgi:ComF family protein
MGLFSSWLYPSYCIRCLRLTYAERALCAQCYPTLPLAPSITQSINTVLAMTVHAVSSYEGFVAQLVQAKEQGDQKAAHQLGRVMRQYVEQQQLRYDLVIPVPLHWARYLTRGYNQAHLCARQVAGACFGQVVQPFARWRATKQQRHLSGQERVGNVSGAFDRRLFFSVAAVRTLISGKRIVLVDDVYTTGNTVGSLAAVIALYEPASIDALVGCRVL